MKIKLIEDNELRKRARFHKKHQKGMSPFCSLDGGNVPETIDRFNHSVADDANGLSEAWTIPLSEISSFTGWMDDDKFIDEEERFHSRIERALKTNRNDIEVLIDSDFQYDPRSYEIEDLQQLEKIKTRNLIATKFIVNGIEFVLEDASELTSPRLYFKSESDANIYVNYIDHYYDTEE